MNFNKIDPRVSHKPILCIRHVANNFEMTSMVTTMVTEVSKYNHSWPFQTIHALIMNFIQNCPLGVSETSLQA